MKREHFSAKAKQAEVSGDKYRRLSMAYALGSRPESPAPIVWVASESEHERKLAKQARKQARKDRRSNRKKSRRERGREFRAKYERYIISDAWYRFRDVIFKLRGRKCEECNRTDGIMHLHHLTYQRLGHEKPRDVKILCLACHESLHPHMRA